MAKTDEIQKQPTATSMERPSFIKQGHRGTEHITKDDLSIPRLALAQGLTPQVAEGKEGFTQGVIFNSQTEQIYGKGPIRFFIVRSDKPRFIEFIPRDAGGGVRDMNVSAGDPRTNFTTSADGKRIKPLATKFYDYIVAMLPLDPKDPIKSVISLSFKSSGLKMARNLNMMIKARNSDLFAAVYKLTSIVDPDKRKGVFHSFLVENDGWIESEALLKVAEGMWSSLADKTVSIDRTGADAPEGGDDDDFPHDEREPGQEG